MAQHDYNLENASGFDFRADLNNGLTAIATNNAGATEPTLTFAHMFWFDNTNDLMKVRNEANSAWIVVAKKDGNGWTPYRQGTAITNLATLGSAANKMVYTTGVDTWAEMDVTASSRALLARDDANERLVPAGAVQYFAMNAPPTGWLRANGALLDRTVYAALFDAIGTTFGTSGTNSFNLPDLRGEFIRAKDDARGVDPGRVFGSVQGDQIRSHNHTGVLRRADSGQRRITSNRDDAADGLWATGSNGSEFTDASGGSETRPRNIALLACIKY